MRTMTATNLIQLVIRQGPNLCILRRHEEPMSIIFLKKWEHRYRDGLLLDIARDFLGARAPCELVFDSQDPRYKRLEKFLKKVRVKVRTGPGSQWSRIKTMRKLEPMAGEFEFTNGNRRTMTVKVRLFFFSLFLSPSPFAHWFIISTGLFFRDVQYPN